MRENRALWKKGESELGVSSNGVKHYFSGRDEKGKVVVEAICVNSKTQFLIQQQEYLPKKS